MPTLLTASALINVLGVGCVSVLADYDTVGLFDYWSLVVVAVLFSLLLVVSLDFSVLSFPGDL